MNVANAEFEEKFLEILNELAPLAKTQPRKSRSDWISNQTKNLMKQRDNVRDKAVTSSQREDWQEYRTLRNLCSTKVKQDRSTKLKQTYEKLQKNMDSSGLYKLTKSRMGWKTSMTPESFLKNGKLETSPRILANIQADYFQQKVQNLTNKLPIQTKDPTSYLREALARWTKSDTIPKLVIKTVTVREVISLIKELGNSRAFGHEGIDCESLKICPDAIAAPIAAIINKSIESGKFPNRWKLARIIPLHKGGGKSRIVPDSYRPISLLPAVSKLAEKVIQKQLESHMESQGLWHGNLHSYRKRLSTTTALAQVCDTYLEASDAKEIAASIAVDESCAFDSLSHHILIEKLKLYKLHDVTVAWITDYLRHRSQYVTIGAQDSRIKNLDTGIPQGSILGPTLFNIYVNDLPEVVNRNMTCQEDVHQDDCLFSQNCRKCGNITIYADDAVYTTSSKDRKINQERLSEMLTTMKDYLNNNRMSMNPTKTILWEFMCKQKACKVKGVPPKLITFNEQGHIKEVNPSKEEKCLGARLQGDMQWKAHIDTGKDALLPTLRKKLGALKYLAKNIPRHGRQLLANSLILGKINNLLPLYGGTQPKYLNKLQVVMNNAARFVSGAGRRVSTIQLMEQVNWLTIRELTTYHTLVLAWKMVRFSTPRHLANKITIHPDYTMTTEQPRLQNTEMGLRWRIVHEWNTIPQELREAQSLPRFKLNTKKWLKTQRTQPQPPSPPPSPPPPPHPPSPPPPPLRTVSPVSLPPPRTQPHPPSPPPPNQPPHPPLQPTLTSQVLPPPTIPSQGPPQPPIPQQGPPPQPPSTPPTGPGLACQPHPPTRPPGPAWTTTNITTTLTGTTPQHKCT